MSSNLAGELYSVAAAIVWAFAVVLFRKSGERVAPLALNLFKGVIGTALITLTLLAVCGLAMPRAPAMDYIILCASGILGIAVSDTLFFEGLNRIGGGLTAIVDCLYSPLVVVFSFFLLGERITPGQSLGALMILSAIILLSYPGRSAGIERSRLISGVIFTCLSMITVAASIVMAKPVLDRQPVLWSSAVRFAAGTAALLAYSLASRGRREIFACFRPSAEWRLTVTASVLGAYFAVILWIAGMKYTLASVAAILNQLNTIFLIVLSVILLGEKVTPAKVVASCLALAGAALVAVS